MTRCNNEDVRINLKSSVYNQTGQSYFQQLSAYNSMNAHLRRVLLAKSVVDTKNREYIRARSEKCKTSCRSRSLDKNITQDIIDKLAYDTEHHPCDILRMSCNDLSKNRSARCHYQDHWNACCSRTHFHTHRICPDLRNWNSRGSSKKSSSPSPNRKASYWSARHKKCFEETSPFVEKHKNTGRISRIQNKAPQREAPRSRKCRYEDQDVCYDYPSSFESTPDVSCDGSPRGEENNHSEAESFARRKSKTDSVRRDEYGVTLPSKRNSNCEEDAKYTQFAYDITKRIMQNGLYTDKELQKVFTEHLRKNTGILNKTRMLREIHRLKLSLNVLDDEEDDDDDEDEFNEFIVVKPPTPPKILDENKILSKLESYQKLEENRRTSSNGMSGSNKNVVLVDANPDLLLTERDVLLILMEMNLTPQQTENIYRKLQHNSRDTSLVDTEQVKARREVTDRGISRIENASSNCQSFDKSQRTIVSSEGKSSTTNLIDKKNEMIQTDALSDFKDEIMPKENHSCLCNYRSGVEQYCQAHLAIPNFSTNNESTDTRDRIPPDSIIYPSANVLSPNHTNQNKNTETTTISKKYKVPKPIQHVNVASKENLKFSKLTMLRRHTMNIVEPISEVNESINSVSQDKSESPTYNSNREEPIEDNVEILEDTSENLISSKSDVIESIEEDSAANDCTETSSSHENAAEKSEINNSSVDIYIAKKLGSDDDDVAGSDETGSSLVTAGNEERKSSEPAIYSIKKEKARTNRINDSIKVSESRNRAEGNSQGYKYASQESTSSTDTLTRDNAHDSSESNKECSECFKKIRRPWKRTKPLTMTPILESPDSDIATSPAKFPRKSNLKDPKKLTATAKNFSRNNKNSKNHSSSSDYTGYSRLVNSSKNDKKMVSHQNRSHEIETDSTASLKDSAKMQQSKKQSIAENKEEYSGSSEVLWASKSAKDLYMKKYTNSTRQSDSSSREDDMEDEDTEQKKESKQD